MLRQRRLRRRASIFYGKTRAGLRRSLRFSSTVNSTTWDKSTLQATPRPTRRRAIAHQCETPPMLTLASNVFRILAGSRVRLRQTRIVQAHNYGSRSGRVWIYSVGGGPHPKSHLCPDDTGLARKQYSAFSTPCTTKHAWRCPRRVLQAN
jgi:hypothetical protein